MNIYNSRKAFLGSTLGAMALALTACGGGGGGDNGGTNPPPSNATYSLGGSVTGLAGSGLVLQDNAGHQVAVNASGSFTLATGMASGTSYVVTVKTQPSSPNQTCTVGNGSGSIASANVTNVAVSCVTNGYTIGGQTSGLTGSGLVLQNNGGDNLSVTADGTFAFATPIPSNGAYSVTVKTQPANPAQVCTVSSGAGTVANNNIGTVAISCSTMIVEANAKLVAAIGNGVAESLTQVAELMGSRLLYLDAQLPSTAPETCLAHGADPAGSVSYQFTDNDGDLLLTSGDVVAMVFSSCYLPSLAGTLDLSLAITLGAAPQPVDYRSGFSGKLSLIKFPLSGEKLDGTLDIVFKDHDNYRQVQGTVGTGGLNIAVTLAGTDDVVNVLSGTAKKTIDYLTAKYEVTAEADYRSSVVAGRFTMATTTPLTGLLNVYPDKGVEVFRSGQSVLRYTAQNAASNSTLDAALDSEGTGTFSSAGTHAWTDSAKGFLWWEPRSGTVYPPTSNFAIDVLGAWKMRLMLANPLENAANFVVGTNVAPNVAITMFFSGPVKTTGQAMTFVGQGGALDVPATFTITGGIARAVPLGSLVPGASYRLTPDNGAIDTALDVATTPEPFHLDLTVALP
jgi:hypothetical protein